VLVEGLALLHNLIKQDAHTLNETSIQRIERHVQKLANAAQISFAECALLHDQNQMLTRMNNEAKVRRSTRSIVLGKAKVMSFEDIEVARAARAAKEVIKGKGKRGRKRKSTALEADKPETEPEEAEPEVARAAKEAINGSGKRGRKRKSAAQEAEEPELEVARMIDAPVPWRAPVARMI
jgi:septum formation inhibitor MinC